MYRVLYVLYIATVYFLDISYSLLYCQPIFCPYALLLTTPPYAPFYPFTSPVRNHDKLMSEQKLQKMALRRFTKLLASTMRVLSTQVGTGQGHRNPQPLDRHAYQVSGCAAWV